MGWNAGIDAAPADEGEAAGSSPNKSAINHSATDLSNEGRHKGCKLLVITFVGLALQHAGLVQNKHERLLRGVLMTKVILTAMSFG